MYVREDIPTQRKGSDVREHITTPLMESAFVCQRRYTDSMKGVYFCMSEKVVRLLLLYVREDIPTQ